MLPTKQSNSVETGRKRKFQNGNTFNSHVNFLLEAVPIMSAYLPPSRGFPWVFVFPGPTSTWDPTDVSSSRKCFEDPGVGGGPCVSPAEASGPHVACMCSWWHAWSVSAGTSWGAQNSVGSLWQLNPRPGDRGIYWMIAIPFQAERLSGIRVSTSAQLIIVPVPHEYYNKKSHQSG